MTDLRAQVAFVAGEKNPLPIYSGTLADDYDGISEYVAVALSRGAAGAAIARVAPGSSLSGQFAPSGTAVSVISINGHLEVISLGSRVATNYTVTTIETGYVEPTISPVVLQAGELVDSSDSVSVSSEGLTGGWGRLIQSGGIYNADWELLPPDSGLELSADNLPPYWKYFYSSNPSTAHLQIITLDETYSKVLRCTLDSGSGLGDCAWVGQTIAAAAQVDVSVKLRFGPVVDGTTLIDIIADWYTDGGGFLERTGGGQLLNAVPGAAANGIAIWNLNLLSPPDAASVKLWFGIRVNTAPGAQRYFDILQVGVVSNALLNIKLPDTDPTTADNTSEIFEFNRTLRLIANSGGLAGTQPTIILDGSGSPGVVWLPTNINFGTGGDADLYRDIAWRVRTTGDFRSTGVLITLDKAGTPSDSDYVGGTAPNAGLIVDTTNHRIWARSTGWKYVSLTTPSDERLKTNIKPLDSKSAIELLQALRPVTFHWRNPESHGLSDRPNDGDRLGFLAQDVRGVLPHWVTQSQVTPDDPEQSLIEDEQVLLIDPPSLEALALLVAAVQELTGRVVALEAKLAGG